MRTPEAKDEIMITTTVTTTTTTATPICAGNIPPCNPPANSAGLITNTMADDTSLDTPGTFVCYTASWIHPGLSFPLKPPAHIKSAQVGTCTCNQAGLVEHFFTGATQNRVFFPNDYDMRCKIPFSPGTCVCDSGKEGRQKCYRPTDPSNDLLTINMVAFCDDGGCFFYATLFCIVGNPNSGLKDTATGLIAFSCAQQIANPPLGSNSPYLKVTTLDCETNQCITGCQQCGGPFSPCPAGCNVADADAVEEANAEVMRALAARNMTRRLERIEAAPAVETNAVEVGGKEL